MAAALRAMVGAGSRGVLGSPRHGACIPPLLGRIVPAVSSSSAASTGPNNSDLLKIISAVEGIKWLPHEKVALQREVIKLTGGLDSLSIINSIDEIDMLEDELFVLRKKLSEKYPGQSLLVDLELNEDNAEFHRILKEEYLKNPQATRFEMVNLATCKKINSLTEKVDIVMNHIEASKKSSTDWTSFMLAGKQINIIACISFFALLYDWFPK